MYKQPPMLDSYIALKTLAWFKFALFFHVLVGTLMYANSEILQSSEAGELLGPDLVEWLEGHEFFDFLQLHTLVFFLTFVGMIAVYILWKCLCKPIYKSYRKGDSNETVLSSSSHFIRSSVMKSDVYECMSVRQLYAEYQMANKQDKEMSRNTVKDS
jgi:hypothetical protein